MTKSDQQFYETKYFSWDAMKDFGPTARHTRRIVLDWIKLLDFIDVIDISCGGGQLLFEINKMFSNKNCFGTEFTEKAVEVNRKRHEDMIFETFDIENDAPLIKRDLVLCIDVLEHIHNDRVALQKLSDMTKKYLLLAVPLGKVSASERISLGHLHGYYPREILDKLESANLTVTKSLQWGFPFYQIIRTLTKQLAQSPAEGKVTPIKKIIFNLLYGLYFVNIPILGGRFFVLCEPRYGHEAQH